MTVPVAQRGKDRKEEVLAVLAAKLPETPRVWDIAAIIEETGRVVRHKVSTAEVDLAARTAYDEYEAALASLVTEGLVAEVDLFGALAFHLTGEGMKHVGIDPQNAVSEEEIEELSRQIYDERKREHERSCLALGTSQEDLATALVDYFGSEAPAWAISVTR